MTYDEIRARYPDLAISIYGLTPGGPVTLEIIAPDEKSYTFTGPTQQTVLDMAFPPAPPVSDQPTDADQPTDIFS